MESETNATPVLSYMATVSTDYVDEQTADACADTGNFDETDTNRPDGEQVACCWLNNRMTASDYLLGGGATLGGLLTIGAGFLNPGGKPEEATASMVAFAGFGGVLLLIGLAIFVLKLMTKSEGIEVTAEGIEWIREKESTKYRWNEINKVLIGEFTATRLSDTDVNCQLDPLNGKTFRFQTSYLGDPQAVLGCVLTNCDYIVRNPEGYTRNVK